MRSAVIVVGVSLAVAGVAARAEDHEKEEKAGAAKVAPDLAVALKGAKVTLAKGLQAAEKQGRPLSAKFEVEDGKLQLSVYTEKGGKFFELVVDHQSGKIAKTEEITSGEDLAAAKRQQEAMAKTKRTLRDVVTAAEKANAGFQAVSVTPELEGGAAEADVGLLKGTESKTAEEKL
jgi:hypothetical protein